MLPVTQAVLDATISAQNLIKDKSVKVFLLPGTNISRSWWWQGSFFVYSRKDWGEQDCDQMPPRCGGSTVYESLIRACKTRRRSRVCYNLLSAQWTLWCDALQHVMLVQFQGALAAAATAYVFWATVHCCPQAELPQGISLVRYTVEITKLDFFLFTWCNTSWKSISTTFIYICVF